MNPKSTPDICIIGAGFSGICAGIKLKKTLDIHDFVIFDENEDVGGTWLVNNYPGCACDIPSHLYSFSFELNPEWTQTFSAQPEIWQYLKNVATKHSLEKNLRFNIVVVSQVWQANLSKWKVTFVDKISGQSFESLFDIVISAVGALREPLIPTEFVHSAFKGKIMHTARWDSKVDLTGKRVAIVGTGASAIQVVPVSAGIVSDLHVFQRKPAWIVNRNQSVYSGFMKWVFRNVPGVMYAYRSFIYLYQELSYSSFTSGSFLNRYGTFDHENFLKRYISDEKLKKQLTPSYKFGCKRILLTDDYIRTFTRPNVHLHTGKVERVSENGLVVDGVEFPVDVVVLATGFKVQDFFAPLQIIGRNAFDVLSNWRKDAPQTYLGIVAANVPNTFILLGPSTGLGHNSIIVMIECQVDYTMQLIAEMMKRQAATIEVKEAAQVAFGEYITTHLKKTIWGSEDCGSWYANSKGQITVLWPDNCQAYVKMTRDADFSKYTFTPRMTF